MHPKAINPTTTVNPIHFEDFDGIQFERLVFAYHVRTVNYRSIEWYGQSGKEGGRDIWSVRENDTKDGETQCIQCANRDELTFKKASEDILKVIEDPKKIPHLFHIITGCKVSKNMREKIIEFAKSKGLYKCKIWSGTEFEEFLRRDCESLLKRFIDGETFPDAPSELCVFAVSSLNDEDVLQNFATLFVRPAFYTPIHQESSLPAFKQAITDTIEALATGLCQNRSGVFTKRIPSFFQLKNTNLKNKILGVSNALAKLRAKFDDLTRKGAIRSCACNNPDCSTYTMSIHAANQLEEVRRESLSLFKEAYPKFETPLW